MIFDVFRQIAADFPDRPCWVFILTGFLSGLVNTFLFRERPRRARDWFPLHILTCLLWSVYWSAWRWL